MYNWEETLRDHHRYRLQEKQNPSFSSSLLDKIYRSIDEGDTKGEELRFRRDTMVRKQSRNIRAVEEEKMLNNLRQECLLDKWMEIKKVKEKARSLKLHRDHDALFFSTSSNSSDSSSGGLSSSSDTEPMCLAKPTHSCFARPKWSHTGSEKTTIKQRPLFCKKRPMFDDLKNLKQPVSPGRRLVSFLNSIFTITAGNVKKSKNPSSTGGYQSDCVSTKQSVPKSASSLSRSCLSKNSPASREKMRNGAKRSVRFCPVSVILDEGSNPNRISVTVPNPWGIAGKSQSNNAMEKSRRVEEAARGFLRKYHQNQNQNHNKYEEDNDDDDDDAASCSSSDLFELDHLAVAGNEELPVYETTRLDRNRAIAMNVV